MDKIKGFFKGNKKEKYSVEKESKTVVESKKFNFYISLKIIISNCLKKYKILTFKSEATKFFLLSHILQLLSLVTNMPTTS